MPRLAEAIEANLAEEMTWFGRAHPQGELHKTPELLWITTSLGHPNAVLRSSFASDKPSYLSSQIDAMRHFFAERGGSFGWTTGPSTRPLAFAELLESSGFIHRASTTGMAMEIQAAHVNFSTNQELAISEVEDLEALQNLCDIERLGFGTSEQGAQLYYETYAHAGFGHGSPWHHYLGWLLEEPVASASLLYHAGVAGIYGVATIPTARRQGIAAAMTLHILQEARRLGYAVTILSPSAMSEALYRRMGFRDYCTLEHYEWLAGA